MNDGKTSDHDKSSQTDEAAAAAWQKQLAGLTAAHQ